MKILGKSIEELFDLAEAPESLIPFALKSIEEARKVNRKALPYRLSAPIVMAWVCPRLEWEAEYLPHRYRHWDNEISINGDRGDWYMDEVENRFKRHPVPYEKGNSKNSRGKWYNYYAPKKLSPRHWFSRYIWLGWRNRAVAYFSQFGAKEPEHDKLDLVKKWEYSTEKEYVEVLYYETYMQVYYKRKVGPLHLRANLGYKLFNIDGVSPKARPVYTPFSFKIRPNTPL